MTDEFICHVEDCEWTGESLPSLRSHVSGRKDNDHQQARRNKAWEGWYPEAAGVPVPATQNIGNEQAAGRTLFALEDGELYSTGREAREAFRTNTDLLVERIDPR